MDRPRRDDHDDYHQREYDGVRPFQRLTRLQAYHGARRRRGKSRTMTARPPWHITHGACERYAFVCRWPATMTRDAVITRATRELSALAQTARYKDFDRLGRERWRCGRPSLLVMIVDPGPVLPHLPTLIWVGQGRPPASVWTPER